jgi:lipopolysaccharide/colanic/teichoic acid biosynthesis glycosyltransferase
MEMELTTNQLRLELSSKRKGFLYFSYSSTKRTADILVSVIVLALLSPLLLVVALLIKLTSKGPVIYIQKRVGLKGEVIHFPKFRSMVQDADYILKKLRSQNDHKDGYTFKMKKDPRVTRVGHFIRKFSIDELPQLWLVLTGKMTLVGPRPAIVSEVEKYNDLERQRLVVKPGLTCIWQVSGRGDIPFREQLAMDIEYINNQSVVLDTKLLVLTIPAVLTGKGAY